MLFVNSVPAGTVPAASAPTEIVFSVRPRSARTPTGAATTLTWPPFFRPRRSVCVASIADAIVKPAARLIAAMTTTWVSPMPIATLKFGSSSTPSVNVPVLSVGNVSAALRRFATPSALPS